MPDWIWVLALFLMLTFGYCIGYATGSYKNDPDKAPTENAYIREAEINAAVWKDVEIRKAELEHETALEHYRIAAEIQKRKEKVDGNML